MKNVVIASAARLGVGRLGGTLVHTEEVDMAVTVIREAMRRAGDFEYTKVDELVMGQNFRTGILNSNCARIFAIEAGFPNEMPEFTLNKHCGAGIKAVTYAFQAIRSETAEVVLTGAIDQMTKACHFVPGARWGVKVGHLNLIDQLVMRDYISNLSMIQSNEKLAKEFNISRKEQDEYDVLSENKAERAIKDGEFKEEIVPLEVTHRGSKIIFDQDECPKFGTTLKILSGLRPIEVGGTITAGNASSMSDGAAALLVMSEEKAKENNIKPLAKIVSFSYVGVEPSLFGIAPVPAIKNALKDAGLTIDDIDLIELNEAFASQTLYCLREFKIDPNSEKLNINGGAIALGHPIAATGAVILTKLLYSLKKKQKRYGLAAMCIGGGQGIAIIVDAKTD